MLSTIDFWNYLFIFTSKKGKNMKRNLTLGGGGGGGAQNCRLGGQEEGWGDMSPPVYMLKEALFISANNMLLALMK